MQAQGSFSQITMQMENAYKTLPTSVKAKKVYFADGDPGFTQGLEDSNVMRGASRQPTAPTRGAVDSSGSINTELQATSPLLYAAMGSMESTMTGGVMGTALTTPAAVIDAVNQLVTLTVTAHGLVVGDSVEILAITAPTTLNGKIWPVDRAVRQHLHYPHRHGVDFNLYPRRGNSEKSHHCRHPHPHPESRRQPAVLRG